MSGAGLHRPIVVMESFRPNAQTNPYLLLLLRTLEADTFTDDVAVITYRRRTALCGRYDVLHLHWPEVLMQGRTWPRRLAKSLLFLVVLCVARLRGRAIVRTLHNAAPHERQPLLTRVAIGLTNRWTDEWIALSATTAPPGRAPSTTVIPHGHYSDWYPPCPDVRVVPGRLLFFGLVRSYKGVEELLATVLDTPDPALSLRIVGHADDPDLIAAIEDSAESDERITASLSYASERLLASEIAAAQLVVLPYRSVLNSGSVLLALSLGRPVLVPSSASMRDLVDEVGPRWVRTYDAPLTPAILARSLSETPIDHDRPDLSARDWDRLADAHVRVFLRAGQK